MTTGRTHTEIRQAARAARVDEALRRAARARRPAATLEIHPYRPDEASTQCGTCWGWADDYRHLGPERHG